MRNAVNPSFRKAAATALALVALAFMTNGSALAEEVTRVFRFASRPSDAAKSVSEAQPVS